MVRKQKHNKFKNKFFKKTKLNSKPKRIKNKYLKKKKYYKKAYNQRWNRKKSNKNSMKWKSNPWKRTTRYDYWTKHWIPMFSRSKGKKMSHLIATVYVKCTHNNTIINISKPNGKTIICLSTGMLGFKNKWKSSIFSAKKVAIKSAMYAWKKGIRIIQVKIRGVRYRKRPIIQSLSYGGLMVYQIIDVTPKPHNGCRKKKRKR